MPHSVELESQLKELIIDKLNLEDYSVTDISSEEPLFSGSLALDSIDALELGIAIKKKFGVKIEVDDNINDHFYSVQKLANFISLSMKTSGVEVEK